MTRICIAPLAALALCRPLTAQPVPALPPTPKAAIQAAYDGLGAAFQAHDLDRFMAYFAPDYVDHDKSGKNLTREQVRQGYRKQLGQMKTMQSHYVLQSVTPTAAGTLVEMKMHSQGTGEKRILFAKVRGHFTDDLWVRDLWVNTPQGWKLQHRQTLKDDLHTGP